MQPFAYLYCKHFTDTCQSLVSILAFYIIKSISICELLPKLCHFISLQHFFAQHFFRIYKVVEILLYNQNL